MKARRASVLSVAYVADHATEGATGNSHAPAAALPGSSRAKTVKIKKAGPRRKAKSAPGNRIAAKSVAAKKLTKPAAKSRKKKSGVKGEIESLVPLYVIGPPKYSAAPSTAPDTPMEPGPVLVRPQSQTTEHEAKEMELSSTDVVADVPVEPDPIPQGSEGAVISEEETFAVSEGEAIEQNSLPETDPSTPEKPKMFDALHLQFISLLQICLRGWYWIQNKLKTHQVKKRLRICETVSLGEKRFIAVIQVDGEQFLVGGSANSVATLAHLDAQRDFSDELRNRCEQGLSKA